MVGSIRGSDETGDAWACACWSRPAGERAASSSLVECQAIERDRTPLRGERDGSRRSGGGGVGILG